MSNLIFKVYNSNVTICPNDERKILLENGFDFFHFLVFNFCFIYLYPINLNNEKM